MNFFRTSGHFIRIECISDILFCLQFRFSCLLFIVTYRQVLKSFLSLKVIHENPPNATSNGVSATVDEGGFLRGNKDKGKVIVFTAPKVANGR